MKNLCRTRVLCLLLGLLGCEDGDNAVGMADAVVSDASPDTPADSTTDLLAPTERARALAARSACLDERLDVDAILDGIRAETPTSRCLANAADCTAVLACIGMTQAPCDLTAPPTCDGEVAVSCVSIGEATTERRQDCRDASENPNCAMVFGRATCVFGECAAEGTRCDDDVLWRCDDGHSRRTDCAALGLRCRETTSGPACVTTRPCDEDRCEGDTLIECALGYEALPVDCNALDSTVHCDGSAPGCGLERWLAACDGTSIAVAREGSQMVTLDCAAFPGAGCSTEWIGNQQVIRCLPPTHSPE